PGSVAEPAGGSCPGGTGAAGASSGSAAPPGIGIHVLGNLAEIGAEGVIAVPGRRIGQHVVGLGDFLEPVFGGRIGVDIRVIRARKLPVSPLDIFLPGIPRDTQDLVEVAVVGHQSALATTTCAGRSWCSRSPYPARTTSSIVPASASVSPWTATAS